MTDSRDKEEGQAALEQDNDSVSDSPPVTEERDVSALVGLKGERDRPLTIADQLGFLEPGRAEFDAQSQFVEVYRSPSRPTEDEPGGATQDFFDMYAWTDKGEVARKSAELDYDARGSYHLMMARRIANELLAPSPSGVNEVRASLRRDFIKPGLVVDWEVVRTKARDFIGFDLARRPTPGPYAEPFYDALNEIAYHMEQEGQNNFHGWEGPLPYRTVHVVPDESKAEAEGHESAAPTSYCEQPMYVPEENPHLPEKHKAVLNEKYGPPQQPLWITEARFVKYGMPPFCPPCFDCLTELAHKAGTEIGATEVEEKPQLIAQATAAQTSYEQRVAWFFDVAQRHPNAPLSVEDALEWAKKMTDAELAVLYPRGAGRFTVEYDDLIGVATAEDTQVGAFAALESETVDAWTRALPGQENVEARSRVLLSLVTDKLLNNPDVIRATLNSVPNSTVLGDDYSVEED